jgi:hypothetical protein
LQISQCKDANVFGNLRVTFITSGLFVGNTFLGGKNTNNTAISHVDQNEERIAKRMKRIFTD